MRFKDCIKNNRTYIIAEMSANHGGSLKKAVEENSVRMSKENKINRWLLILCFIILVIIHFV